MFKKFVFAVAALLASISLGASPLPEYPFIHARASAARYVVPDRGAIDFEILARDADPEAARAVVEERIAQVRALVTGVALPLGDVEIRQVRREMPKGGEGKPELAVFELRCGVRLKVDDLSKWAALTLPLMSMPNLDGFSTAFSSSERERIESELVNEAIGVAKKRGEMMAAGFGRKLGPVAGVSAGELRNVGGALALALQENRMPPPTATLQLQGRESLGTIGAFTMSQSVDVVFRIK